MQKKLQIRRVKNLWVPLKDNFCTPCAVWDLDLDLLEGMIPNEVRKKIFENLNITKYLENEAFLKLKDLLILLSTKLQSGGSDEVFDWLLHVNSKHSDQRFCYPFLDEKVAEKVGPIAVNYILKFNLIWTSGTKIELAQEDSKNLLNTYKRQVSAVNPYSSTLRLLIEAAGRQIPFRRHSDRISYQLGIGSQRELINHGYTGHTSQLATNIATHKYLAASVMRQASLPAPKHIVVKTFEEAQVAAGQIKYPLVMKPTSTDKGVGVTVGIASDEELKFAWSQAAPYGLVLIEQMLNGFDHRLHVVDGKCIYVVRRTPPYVIGNGRDTLEKLVSISSMKRSSHPLYKNYGNVSLADPVVQQFINKNGLLNSTVIEADKIIYLRSNSNVSTGGTLEDVTEIAHPDNLRLAERAARIVGLDNAGIDFITTDIRHSWLQSSGGICEINPTPGVVYDSAYDAILNYLFKKPKTGRIPIILFVGEASLLKNSCDLLKISLHENNRSFGGIYDLKLNIFTANGVFVAPGKSTQDLLPGLLTDELVEFAFIQLDFEEIRMGLDLHYIDLLVAVGTESETSIIQESDLMSRCHQDNVLINPTNNRFEEAMNDLLESTAAFDKIKNSSFIN